MKTDFVLYKENSKTAIVVNETTNSDLLKRCQDCWYHTKDIKYFDNKNLFAKMGLKALGGEKQKTDFLFVHIPKTGGISFKFNVIYNPHMTKKISIYHKIHYPPKPESELDIFKTKRKMFTLLRDPESTVVSAFYHFNHALNMSIDAFCSKFSNIQVKFLLGYDIFSQVEVTEKDVQKIIDLIESKKLIVGIHQTEKMKDIYNLLGIPLDQVDNYVLNKKKYVHYKPSDISKDLKKRLKAKNHLDRMLYEYVLNS